MALSTPSAATEGRRGLTNISLYNPYLPYAALFLHFD